MNVVVLMSTYNGEKYLREQIDSILNQNRTNINCIDLWVRDDGSMDSTVHILEEYASKRLLNWYTGPNLGPGKSFMDLVEHCKGYDYYFFSDQDDVWLPDKIVSAIQRLSDKKGPAVYCSNAQIVDSNLSCIRQNVYSKSPKTDLQTMSCAGGILGCTMAFNSDMAEIVCHQRQATVYMHDFYICVLCVLCGGQILYDERSFIYYRQHNGNMIGVSKNICDKARSMINAVAIRKKIGIAEQAQDIIDNYSIYITTNDLSWMRKIAQYRICLGNRILLACSKETKYGGIKKNIRIRLEILLGNR